LNGVVIRIAQKLGLHHDGEKLGLGPFESEMRRRLWWQIIMVDAKYAMLTGLSHSLLPRNWDIKEPKNLNDADLFPSATEPFQDREGPTEMIFCLIANKVGKFLIESPGYEVMIMLIECGVPKTAETPEIQEFRRTIERLAAKLLELVDRFSDPTAGPVHEMALEMRSQIIQKLTELVTAQEVEPGCEGEMYDPKNNAFKMALSALEHDERTYKIMKDKGFLWFWLVHFQIDVFVFLAGQLCNRTEGQLVERAWRQVGVVYRFHPDLLDMTNKTYLTLARFILKAWAGREVALACRLGQHPEVPDYIENLRRVLPNDDTKPELIPTRLRPDILAASQVNPVPDQPFDQLLGSYLDSSLDWDMFSGMPANVQNLPPFRYSMGPF